MWLIFWLLMYHRPEDHQRLSPAEFEHIRSDPPEKTDKVAWAKVFPKRQTWAFAIGKFLTDPIWWFFLFWLPKFLNQQYGLTIDTMGLPLVIIYVAADIGSIGGGWLSSALIKRGWTYQCGSEDGDARMRSLRRADHLCREGIEFMGCRRPRKPGNVRPPGMVGKPVYNHVGYVP